MALCDKGHMSHPLQGRAAARIHELFVLTVEQSQIEAAGLLDAIDAHSGNSSNWSVVEERIEEQLGSRLSWRSQSAKEAVEKRRADGIKGYSGYLDKRRNLFDRSGSSQAG